MDADRLLELQRLDTAADQAAHRRSRLAERAAHDAAAGELSRWQAMASDLQRRLAELADSIQADEAHAEHITATRARLEAQLKTVIAPREAEALLHEIDVLTQQRNELDDHELAQLDAQVTLEAELAEHAAAEGCIRDQLAAAGASLEAAEAAIDAELAELAVQRAAIIADLAAPVVEVYELQRRKHGGVAIARLVGQRCDGCHLDLSLFELDDVKAARADGIPECPQCGRLLVV
jgi:hypothetical protein